jgi:hypothetical protein
MTMDKNAQVAYANGYQDALADIKAKFDQDGPEAALTYITDHMVSVK